MHTAHMSPRTSHPRPPRSRRLAALGLALLALSTAIGCNGEGPVPLDAVGLGADTPLPRRKGTLLLDACGLDPWHEATLARPSTRAIAGEVLLLCMVPRDTGALGPADKGARAALERTVASLRSLGYQVSLGVAFTDETGARYDAERTRGLLRDPAFRDALVASLEPLLPKVDAVDLDLMSAPVDARADLTRLVAAVSAKTRQAKKPLGLLLPPSVATPSDLPNGEAFDRAALAASVDRFRVMTLDYSDTTPGPTLDPGWATDAVRLALREQRETAVAVPLYGTDFGPRGPRGVSVLEARGLASTHGAVPRRGPTGALTFSYAEAGATHEVWYDDAESTGLALGAFATSLPPEVGVLYYGLGAEDPSLFQQLAERTQ